MTVGCLIVGRNDNYGENLHARATYSINSFLTEMDQVVYVDWNTENGKPSLIDEIKDDLLKTGKLFYTVVSPELAYELTPKDPDAQAVCEVLARNIGLRKLETDYKISTNLDIVCPKRALIDKLCVHDTMITAGKRNMPFEIMITLGDKHNPDEYRENLYALNNSYGQQPVVKIMAGDEYSLVSGCGDWQMAHKDLWNTIRGFEERLYKRMCADTNVQRKAHIFGYKIKVDWSLPVWHINHGGGSGGKGGANDPYLATFMCETTNPDTWGFNNVNLEWKSL